MARKIIIIGGGPGGYVCALRAAALGGEVTLIEKENLGGTCLNWGCIPSKVMKNASDKYLKFLKSNQYGIKVDGSITMDMDLLNDQKKKIIAGQRNGIHSLLKGQGVSVVMGEAKIEAEGKVSVILNEEENGATSKLLEYDRLVLATGTKPLQVEDFTFDHDFVLSSNDLLSLDSIPKSMVIVGGGVIGCEFAGIFSALGTKVTIVEAMSRLLPLPFVDEEISKILLREMKKQKIKVILDAIVKSIIKKDNMLSIVLETSPFTDNLNPKPLKNSIIDSHKAAVCIGREALSKDIGLEKIGVELLKGGWIQVDDKMQTSNQGVYAIGDILGPQKVMLAHVASHEGMVAANNVMVQNVTDQTSDQAANQEMTMYYRVIPGAVFTSPEIGVVGLSQTEAVKKGLKAKSFSVNFRNLGKAHAIGEISGMAKIIVDEPSNIILGAHIIGAHSTDLIAEATLAVQNKLTIEDIAHTIHAHPTLAEIMGEVALKAMGTQVHG